MKLSDGLWIVVDGKEYHVKHVSTKKQSSIMEDVILEIEEQIINGRVQDHWTTMQIPKMKVGNSL